MNTTPARPRLHFTAARHWINDPNGLVWHDGEWHLFYQHNPFGDTWGHMSWGHAVSTDLLHWTELPLAIPETPEWMAFSGSVVIDGAAMVACYTGHAQAGGRQVQLLAHSPDRGRTFTPHAGNPVLDIGEADFRDPKVFRHDWRWVMLVSMAQAGALRFYASADLVQWRFLSEFHVPAFAGCLPWECPDLLQIGGHWLLKWDVFEGHPAGHSGALAVPGHFDGTRFTPDGPPQWLDGGPDFYAAIAFGAMPPGYGRRVWIGWMNDHHYAKHTPTSPWRGAMTLPREVTLVPADHGWAVAQQPVRELLALRGAPLQAQAASGVLAAPGVLPPAHDLELAIAGPRWQLHLCDGPAGSAVLAFDGTALRFDRSAAGFPGRYRIACTPDAAAALRIVVDTGSVEVFAGDGRTVITAQVFPPPGHTGVRLVSDAAARLLRFSAWPLR